MGEGTSFGWRGREGKARRRIELKTGGAPSLPPSLCLSPRHQHLRNLSSRSVVIFRTRSPCYFYPRAASVLEIRNGRITRIVISRNVFIYTYICEKGKKRTTSSRRTNVRAHRACYIFVAWIVFPRSCFRARDTCDLHVEPSPVAGKLTMKSGGARNTASKGENLQRCASKPVIIHSLFVKGNRVWISV